MSAIIDAWMAALAMMEFHLDDLLGDVVVFEEPEHTYGIGTLRLRLLRVSLMRSDPGWASAVGVFVDFRGVEHGLREVTVRVEALARHRRRTVLAGSDLRAKRT